MFEVSGKYASAKIFSPNRDEKAVEQIITLCNQDFAKNSEIRIMPDYHYGAGCTIGFTANLGDKVVPNLVGVDIGCGMYVIKLTKQPLDLEKLDNIIRTKIPSGFGTRKEKLVSFENLSDLNCFSETKNKDFFERQLGTLGGGNHFIEIDIDPNGYYYLVIHSGSRNLGKTVADYYQKKAIEWCQRDISGFREARVSLIEKLRKDGLQETIHERLKEFDRVAKESAKYPEELSFLEGKLRESYLKDMSVCQQYASLNRKLMAKVIIDNLSLPFEEDFETIHNYINFKDNIIRKGAISAYEGEKAIIPINMKDGSIIGYGKGNSDWNYSAPHGAGRLMGRNEAKKNISLEDYKDTMVGIYSTSVNSRTLDEAPQAYKSMQEILENITPTFEVEKIIKPVYNFKAG